MVKVSMTSPIGINAGNPTAKIFKLGDALETTPKQTLTINNPNTTGKTREILELNHLVKNLYSSIPMIALTGNEEGDLATLADICLFTGNPEEVCPLGLTPTTSTTVMTVVGDIIVVLMMEKIKFSKDEYAKRHHSGYLGQKAKE